jgi:hypothetical protein
MRLLVAFFFAFVETISLLCPMENSFYIRTKGDKHVYHRVYYEDVVMCDVWASGVRIHLADKPYLWVEATIETLYDLYFRRNKLFIRASSGFIVNTSCILTAEMKPDGGIKLTLRDKKEAILRNSHDYAYYIQNNKRKDEVVTEDTKEKDEIILSTKDVNMAIVKIYETTGESVGRRYIVKRYKELSL